MIRPKKKGSNLHIEGGDDRNRNLGHAIRCTKVREAGLDSQSSAEPLGFCVRFVSRSSTMQTLLENPPTKPQ